MNTRVNYFNDASFGDRLYGPHVIVRGSATPEHEARIRRTLGEWDGFIAAQVGLPDAFHWLIWKGPIAGLSHPWHTFVGLEPTADMPTDPRTVEELVRDFERVEQPWQASAADFPEGLPTRQPAQRLLPPSHPRVRTPGRRPMLVRVSDLLAVAALDLLDERAISYPPVRAPNASKAVRVTVDLDALGADPDVPETLRDLLLPCLPRDATYPVYADPDEYGRVFTALQHICGVSHERFRYGWSRETYDRVKERFDGLCNAFVEAAVEDINDHRVIDREEIVRLLIEWELNHFDREDLIRSPWGCGALDHGGDEEAEVDTSIEALRVVLGKVYADTLNAGLVDLMYSWGLTEEFLRRGLVEPNPRGPSTL